MLLGPTRIPYDFEDRFFMTVPDLLASALDGPRPVVMFSYDDDYYRCYDDDAYYDRPKLKP